MLVLNLFQNYTVCEFYSVHYSIGYSIVTQYALTLAGNLNKFYKMCTDQHIAFSCFCSIVGGVGAHSGINSI